MQRAVIIGAGPAGLTSAYELSKFPEKFQVVVLEESDTVGGISKTVEYHGNRMDIGPHHLYTKVASVKAWWERMMPPDENSDSERVLLKKNRFTRILFRGKFFDYPVKLNAATFENLGLCEMFKVAGSYFKSLLFARDENSLEDFFVNRFGKKLYRMFFEGYTEKVWGRHPKNISPEWGAQRVKGLSGVVVLKNILDKIFYRTPRKIETSLAETFYYPKFGSGQLWEVTAREAARNGAQILLRSKVTQIHRKADGTIEGVTCLRDGEKIFVPCDVLLSSMPLKDLIAGMNGVPDEIRRIAKGLPYRDYITVGVEVERLNLSVPDHWVYVQGADVKMGRFVVYNNWSSALIRDAKTFWLGLEYFCREGDELWTSTDAELAALAASELVKKNLIADAAEAKDCHVERVRKAYPAYFDSYERIGELRKFLDTSANLYCIGRNGQHRYNNIDHSMCTAFEAVKNILSGTSDKSNVWGVNPEAI